MPRVALAASSSDESGDPILQLFADEVPEIGAGIVEIRAVARIPGRRTKLAVHSHDPNIDAVAACVGPRGARIQRVVEQLNGERIDLFPWADAPDRLIRLALAPAIVKSIQLDEAEHAATVYVAKEQVRTAVGPRADNWGLASEITEWKLFLEIAPDADAA